MGRELRTADIARRHGVDRKTAYRWLVELERKFGPRVIGRRGKRRIIFTTEEAMLAVAPLAPSTEKDDRRVRELEERVADAEKRADRMAWTIAGLERQVAAMRTPGAVARAR